MYGEVEVPTNWVLEKHKSYILIMSPERDLKIYFKKIKKTEKFNFQLVSDDFWKFIDPDFNYKVLSISNPSDLNGWDKITKIDYDLPIPDLNFMTSILKEKNDDMYLIFLDATRQALRIRALEFLQIIESTKPDFAAKEEAFAGKSK